MNKLTWEDAPDWATVMLRNKYDNNLTAFSECFEDGSRTWTCVSGWANPVGTFKLYSQSWYILEYRGAVDNSIDYDVPTNERALDKQVGGGHYKDMAIQPIVYCQKNKLNALESFVVKYVSRHKNKNGAEDIKKAIHCLELLLEIEYGIE
jgi:hypothetical protein